MFPRFTRGRGVPVLSALLGSAVAALMLLSTAQSAANPRGSGWYSGTSSRGSADLTKLVSAGGTTYAAGESGTVLKSTDGGETWTGVDAGTGEPVTVLDVVGGNPDSLVVGTGSTLQCSSGGGGGGGGQFAQHRFRYRGARFVAGSFPSSRMGYAALSNGSVLTTADGGKTFTQKSTIPGGSPTDLVATSDETAFAVTDHGAIERTTDGAASWTLVGSADVALHGIAEADSTTLYAVGDGLTVLKSTDAGATWHEEPVTGIADDDLTSVSTAGRDDVLIATASGSQVLRTTDGGETFESVVPSTDGAFAVEFATPTRAIAVGAYGSAEISTDGGATWSAVATRARGPFRVLDAASSLVAYAGGPAGALARTTDGGKSWVGLGAPMSAAVLGISAPTAETVFVLGADGSLRRSDDSGASYDVLDTGLRSAPRAVVALDSEHVVVVGARGIRSSTDGGATFDAVAGGILHGARLAGAQGARGVILAYGPKTLLVSKDGGSTWTSLKRLPGRGIRDVSFGTAAAGYLLDRTGDVWRTTNGGSRWDELDSLGAWHVTGVDFDNARHGFAVVAAPKGAQSGSYMLRTDNAGRSWHPQFLSGGAATALASAGATSYLLAGRTGLYATTSGGDAGRKAKLVISAEPRSASRPTTVTIRGTLRPSHRGETVLVSRSMGGREQLRRVRVGANGVFLTRFAVTGDAVFVAQAFGTADRAAAGTAALRVDRSPGR